MKAILKLTTILLLAQACIANAAATTPNIVYIICDDLGYGDVQCLNPERGKIPTPGIDRIAREGMIFTDAHSGSSVCTPTRYGLLTGRYSWRTHLQSGVVQGFDPCLIAKDRLTVAGLLKEQGYHTAIIGKWHLDFQYEDPQTGKTIKRNGKNTLAPVGSTIPDGPVNRGFDYYHGFHHAGDMKGVIENNTVILHEDEINMLPRLTRKAVEYIDERANTKDQPFFLYVPFGSPHTPILPTKEWKGKSGLGDYADFVMQTDDGVKQILEALDRDGFANNTLVILTSDNGCSKAAGIPDLESKGHYPSADMRGSKADIFDGGHRVPFIARWPDRVKAGSRSAHTMCLTDFMATCAEITCAKLPDNAGEDSVSFLPALSGDDKAPLRPAVVHHSINGSFAIREGKWKLSLCAGSGGWSDPKPGSAGEKGLPDTQLYDLTADLAESKNLHAEHPEEVARLTKLLEEFIANGRSTPGANQNNDTAIKIRKGSGNAARKAKAVKTN